MDPIGGLFLAFPAILPASATLIERHEKEKKESLRLHGALKSKKGSQCRRRRGCDRQDWVIRVPVEFAFHLLVQDCPWAE